MKISFAKVFPLLLIITTFARAGFGWDDAGHKISAYIAWQQMTAQARQQAAEILLSAPEDSDLSVFYASDSRSTAAKNLELFMIASTWADIVRDKKFKNRNSKYHHGSWHYLDTFWREANGKIEIVPEIKSAEENAVERLFAFDKLMRDASVSDADKAIALAWILHIGGDIHQPLHASARVTQYDPKGDQGGNLFMLSPKGAKGDERVSLHWYWDSIIGRNIRRNGDACDTDYLPPIAGEIMKKHPFSKMRARLEIGRFDQWQRESFRIASTKLYPTTLNFGEMPPDDYKKMAFELAQEQIALAGYRLGEMLNHIFGAQQMIGAQENKENIESAAEIRKSGSTIGKGANDGWLWTKTKAALASTDDLRDSTINVDVDNSVVTIKGTVPNKQQKEKAETVVKGIEGVKEVRNMLKVMPL